MTDLPDGQGISVSRTNDAVLDPPARVLLAEAELEKHLDALAEDALDVYPGHEARMAAYMLFLGHIDEVFATKVVPSSTVRIENGLLKARPERSLDLL